MQAHQLVLMEVLSSTGDGAAHRRVRAGCTTACAQDVESRLSSQYARLASYCPLLRYIQIAVNHATLLLGGSVQRRARAQSGMRLAGSSNEESVPNRTTLVGKIIRSSHSRPIA